ncbi:response regulator transcription factor [Uliginosibacterium sp. H1]|uniref:response regulator transcription factor n=1 Tax=Uliginosibacterium sp. H1 TaxID=3114757 RepID=UPI002E18ADC4|nr:response regulator transcription factor [Uliginosibacterium sp. H1]
MFATAIAPVAPVSPTASTIATRASTTVLVSLSSPLLASGVASVLQGQPGLLVQLGATPPESLQDAIADIVVTDYDAGLLMMERQRRTHGEGRGARVMVLTSQHGERAIRTALDKGVHGYGLVGCSRQEFVTGVHRLRDGARWFCPSSARCLAESLAHEKLTPRELDVLGRLAHGESNKDIARRLGVALGTVKAHVKAILEKLHATSRTQAVVIAARRGLVTQDALA